MFAGLTKPRYPKAAIGFGNGTVTAVSLRRRGNGRFSLRGAATTEIPADVLRPSFDERNIIDYGGLTGQLETLLVEAGLAGRKRWSVSLPSASARTAIITLGEVPATRSELDEVLDWKAETAFGVPADEMRVS
ncbi:MAG: hypothetical protein OEQ28_02595, partial [Acidobacteriota bacterium]|nr:hypothetical protein [Acidobacteriota bacterium]